ncbi:MAG TPA: tyrosine--tRNA ligase [Thermoproteales archaeon]|nr:tyrosine--tRNA ligase [Thermoproteales archaeon]
MDLEKKVWLVKRPPTVEVITEDELRKLFETKSHPVAYNGFEPSGLVHLGTGLICAYKMKDLVEAGVKVKILLATYHAWINNKLGGDLKLIKLAAKHFIHAWRSLGVPDTGVEYIFADEIYDDLDYWTKVLLISKELTIRRARRTLEIAGRKEVEAKKVADLLYTPMQVADIFHLGVDICQLGTDQRKANVIAREIGEKIGFWKPVCVHHHLLQGLAPPPVWPLPPGREKEILSEAKMSKSKPKTAIFIYDEPEVIKEKIRAAFCPPRETYYNPILDIVRYIVFREKDIFVIDRPPKYGGRLEYHSYSELEKDYKEGKIHPLDLKEAVANVLIEVLEPVRKYFKNNREALELLSVLRRTKITR